MNYNSFRGSLKIKSNNIESFMKYSITGGIPKYWEYIDIKQGIIEFVDNMFFSDFSFLENEPYRILKDEKVKGVQAISILEAIGRGATKPSEIAKKLAIPQTSLGRPLQVLQDASIITRELPFGESIRSTKKVLYHISDYPIRFWFNIYSPHRSRWHLYSEKKKEELIVNHSSFVLESEFRKLYLESSRYWEGGGIEFDCVRFSDESLKKVIITEIKWRRLSKKMRSGLEKDLMEKYKNSKLSKQYPDAVLEVLSCEDIIELL